MNLWPEPAQPLDAPELLALQRLCFQSESDLLGGLPIPPLMQSLESLQTDLQQQTVLVLRSGDQLIGSVRAHQQNHTCHVGRLMVHPSHQGKGLGQLLMQHIEEKFAGVQRYELFTAKVSVGNIRLYQKLGYQIFLERETPQAVCLVYLEKHNKKHNP
ncbi:GNAT family N-acetyltransferase [Deinococcus roseus]|nr:GNAT family N-acetyltransferase [Deinococcus roseus]